MSYEAPFAGIKVVDLSQGIAGPYAAMLLAQHGAEVIKVEPPDGDWARILGRRYGDHTAFSIAGNLGKRSISVDLKTDEGRALVQRLAADADVFIEGFRPGVVQRLGLGWDELSRANPRLIYMSVSGFGQSGPSRDRPAMDPVLQAFTGMMESNKGKDGVPNRVSFIPVDMCTALYGFQALSAALYARRDEARGRYISVSLLEAAASVQIVRMMATWLEGGQMGMPLVPSGVFPTGRGWLQLSILRDAQFPSLCDALDMPDAKADPRFADNPARVAHQGALEARMEAALAAHPVEVWCQRLTAAGIMHERVNTYADFLGEPQVEASGAVAWLPQPGVDRNVPIPNIPGAEPLLGGSEKAEAPTLGQHTRAVLSAAGVPAGEIDDLLARGILREPKQAAMA
ncbi:MAG: CaiB/BaiF CoA transferase family protein [Alphaproteobacteria bacterium]